MPLLCISENFLLQICAGRFHRVDQVDLAVHPVALGFREVVVDFHPKVPLRVFEYLMHLRTPLLGFILGGAWYRHDRAI